jgi:hypothetical protein
MKESVHQRGKVIYLFATLVILLSAASASLGFFSYFFFALFSALAATVIFRFCHFGAAAVPPILAFLLMGGLFGFSFEILLLSLLPAAVGFTLATGLRRGEDRLSLSIAAAAVSLVIFALLALLALRGAAIAAGADDLFAFALSSFDTLKEQIIALQMESYEEVAKLLAQNGVTYTIPAESAVRALVSQAISLLPAAIILLSLVVSIALIYALSALSRLLGDRRLFDEKNALYTLDPLAAGAYLSLFLVTLFYTDFSSPFYLVCINAAEVLEFLFAFGAILGTKRLFAFIRRMSYSKFDFAVWVILLILCALFYFSTLFTLLAVWQALHILISALRVRKKKGDA